MKLPEDSRIICAGLDQFCLPSALFARTTNHFVGWNKSFMTAVGLSADELAAAPVAAKLFEREDGYSLLIIDGSNAEQSNEDFIRGLLLGKTEEQDRIRQKFHDDVAPRIMAAAFA